MYDMVGCSLLVFCGKGGALKATKLILNDPQTNLRFGKDSYCKKQNKKGRELCFGSMLHSTGSNFFVFPFS